MGIANNDEDSMNKEIELKNADEAEVGAVKIKRLSWILIGGVLAAVFFYAAAILIFTWPVDELSVEKSGVFGDSFGLLTSLFSGLAFAGLIITIVMQRDELALQRKELKLTRGTLVAQKGELVRQNKTMQIQQFESTFFKMLEFFDSIRNDISHNAAGRLKKSSGRAAVDDLYGYFVNSFLNMEKRDVYQQISVKWNDEANSIAGIKKLYFNFYRSSGGELDRYYRTLFNILKLVDRNTFIDDKKLYTNLVRAQLSRCELSLLFYNCLSAYAEEKMTPLVKKYQLLKHLEKETIPQQNHEILELFKSDSGLSN